MKKLLLSGLLLAVCGFATAAHASLITFYASGSGNTASGSLNATLTSPGVYHVTSITGDVNGYAITGLSTFKGADNLLFTAAPQLDANGMSFRVGSIGIDVNPVLRQRLPGCDDQRRRRVSAVDVQPDGSA